MRLDRTIKVGRHVASRCVRYFQLKAMLEYWISTECIQSPRICWLARFVYSRALPPCWFVLFSPCPQARKRSTSLGALEQKRRLLPIEPRSVTVAARLRKPTVSRGADSGRIGAWNRSFTFLRIANNVPINPSFYVFDAAFSPTVPLNLDEVISIIVYHQHKRNSSQLAACNFSLRDNMVLFNIR